MTATDHLSPEDAALYRLLYAQRNTVDRSELDLVRAARTADLEASSRHAQHAA